MSEKGVQEVHLCGILFAPPGLEYTATSGGLQTCISELQDQFWGDYSLECRAVVDVNFINIKTGTVPFPESVLIWAMWDNLGQCVSVCVCVHAGQKRERPRMVGTCHGEKQRSLYRSAFTHLHTRPPSSYLSLSVLCSSTSVTLATERGREGKSNGGKGREARSWQLIVRPLGESERESERERD